MSMAEHNTMSNTVVEALKAELAELRKENADQRLISGMLRVDIVRQKEEIAELRKDRERLDWLQKQKSVDFEWYMQRLDSGGSIPQSIRHGYYTRDERFQTIREAIDAAMEEK